MRSQKPPLCHIVRGWSSSASHFVPTRPPRRWTRGVASLRILRWSPRWTVRTRWLRIRGVRSTVTSLPSTPGVPPTACSTRGWTPDVRVRTIPLTPAVLLTALSSVAWTQDVRVMMSLSTETARLTVLCMRVLTRDVPAPNCPPIPTVQQSARCTQARTRGVRVKTIHSTGTVPLTVT